MSKRAKISTKPIKGRKGSLDATTNIVNTTSNSDGTLTLDVEWSEGYAKLAAKMLGRRKLPTTEVAQFFGASVMASRRVDGTLAAKPSDIRACFAKLAAKAKKPKTSRSKREDELL